MVRVAGIVLGALAGAAYGYFIGCHTGSCPLTSSPWSAGALGAVLGGLYTRPRSAAPPPAAR